MPFDQHLTFPSTTTNLLFLSMTSAFFLDSTYQWTHSAFVFVWLISLGIMSSRSISVVPNIRIVVCQAPLFMGFSRQENWSGLPCPPSRGSSQPMDETQVSYIAGDSLLSEPPGKPKNTGVGSLSILQRIFLTQEPNWGLLHCRQIVYHLSPQGSPRILEWVAYPVSSRSSRPGNWTGSPVLQADSLPTQLSGRYT